MFRCKSHVGYCFTVGIIAGMPGAQQMRHSRPMAPQQQVRPAPLARPITGTPAVPVGQQHAMMPAAMMPPMSAMPQVRAQALPYKMRNPAQAVSGQTMVQARTDLHLSFFR